MTKTLYIYRGVPGTGKSTKAAEFARNNLLKHFEADMFFDWNGQYCFDPDRLNDAHSWCFNKVRNELKYGNSVVVSNTFTKRWELENYLVTAFEEDAKIVITQCCKEYGNIHGVPENKMKVMRERFIDNDELMMVYNSPDITWVKSEK